MKRLVCSVVAAVLGAAAALAPVSAAAAPRRTSVIAFISDRDTPPGSESRDEVYLDDTRTGVTSRLTVTEDPKTHPALSPTGRYLAYQRFDGIEFCRLTASATGWTCPVTRRITVQPLVAGKVVWAPDERSVIYAGKADDEPDLDIYRAQLSGLGRSTNLTEEAPGGLELDDADPAVSPDGRSIVYSRAGNLWRSRIDGTHRVQLTTAQPPAIESGADFSPDGSRIAFHSNRKAPGNPGTDDFDVYVMKPKPEGPRNVPVDVTASITAPGGGPSRERYPSFSPDGKRLAFWRSVGGVETDVSSGEIYTIRVDGTDPVNLSHNNPSDPAAASVADIFPDWGLARR